MPPIRPLPTVLFAASAVLFAACTRESSPEPEATSDSPSVVAAADSPAPVALPDAPRPLAASTATAELASADQQASYGIGYNVGVSLAHEGSVSVDRDAIVAGLLDGLDQARPRLDRETLQDATRALEDRAAARIAVNSEANLAAANAFLRENASRPGIHHTASGLQYEILAANPDPAARHPAAADTVEIHYHGTLLDGTVFDSSRERGESVAFPVSSVIPGWTEALQLMAVGDRWKLYLPPALAYRDRQTARIPPNSALIFEVELLQIVAPAP